jgi:hypothetical protein
VVEVDGEEQQEERHRCQPSLIVEGVRVVQGSVYPPLADRKKPRATIFSKKDPRLERKRRQRYGDPDGICLADPLSLRRRMPRPERWGPPANTAAVSVTTNSPYESINIFMLLRLRKVCAPCAALRSKPRQRK